MTSQERLEKFFNMPLQQIIDDLHWKQNKSIKWLSDQSSVCRKTITKICNENNIKIRTHRESTLITDHRGNNHWAFGLNKDNSIIHKRNSERMKIKNPSYNLDAQTKAALKRSEYFKKNPLPQEIFFKNILNKLNIDFIFQYPIGPYVIDFFIPKINLCIEIDSSNKWCKKKRKAALNKDVFLKKENLKILRISKDKIGLDDFVLNILKSNNIIGEI